MKKDPLSHLGICFEIPAFHHLSWRSSITQINNCSTLTTPHGGAHPDKCFEACDACAVWLFPLLPFQQHFLAPSSLP